ncbi:MAG: hypothetical protein B7Y01_03115 [Xanthobacter sp. 17-67-6]|nr:MAG: hypothetical protein B7Y01_03115 [Xanthobacter sp. 17-67-6]
MSMEPYYSPVSPIVAGLSGRCPRCGKGKLFKGFLQLAPECDACGLDYSFIDAGDGPAVFVILIGGFLVVALAFWVEVTFEPPLWVHALLWIPGILIVTLGLLRPFKGVLVAMQYANRASEGRLEQRDGE